MKQEKSVRKSVLIPLEITVKDIGTMDNADLLHIWHFWRIASVLLEQEMIQRGLTKTGLKMSGIF